MPTKSDSVYYNFSNIRFAAPPLGDLRFQAPHQPLNNRSAGIQNGTYGNRCPQSLPEWVSGGISASNSSSQPVPAINKDESEDCLFLDVVVPEQIFNRQRSSYGSPVMVWIYGGGYTTGDKLTGFNPIGLLDRSNQSVLYVAMNYRVSFRLLLYLVSDMSLSLVHLASWPAHLCKLMDRLIPVCLTNDLPFNGYKRISISLVVTRIVLLFLARALAAGQSCIRLWLTAVIMVMAAVHFNRLFL